MQTELQTLYLVFLSEMIKKKPTFKMRTLKSFIVCSPHWQTRQFQVLTPCFQASRRSTRSLSTEPTLSYSCSVSGVSFKPSLPMSNLTKLVLVVWGLGCKSCRRLTSRPKNWNNKKLTIMKKSMRFFTIRAYRLYPKLFEQRWWAVTTTIFWPVKLHWENLQIVGPKILLANPPPRRQGLCKSL